VKSLIEEEWFHGVLPREEVVRLLTKEGDFLVRETTRNDENQTVLSVCWGGHKHFIVQTTSEVIKMVTKSVKQNYCANNFNNLYFECRASFVLKDHHSQPFKNLLHISIKVHYQSLVAQELYFDNQFLENDGN